MNARAGAQTVDRGRAKALDRACAGAQGLPSALACAQTQAWNIDRLLSHNTGVARVRGLAQHVDYARDLVCQLASHLAQAQALALDLGAAFNCDSDPDAAKASKPMHAITRHLDQAGLLESDLDPALDRARAARLARDILHRELFSALTRAFKSAGDVYLFLERDDAGTLQGYSNDRVAPLAGRLVTAAARLLPPESRSRYREEYQSELRDLAHAGAGHRQQRCYASRQIARATFVRIALQNPRRKKAGP